MQLNYQRQGAGQPLLILHGLFGNLENWGSLTRLLAQDFDIITADLRNHGRSPWDARMDYPSMAEDLLELLDHLQLPRCAILGHSMGGKAAMQLALSHPQRVERLLVADIAPIAYGQHHAQVFAGLMAVEPQLLASRSEADRLLALHIEMPAIRAFLLKNLYREGDAFAWRMNLSVLHEQYTQISAAVEGLAYTGTCRFLRGGNSDYIQDRDMEQIRHLFPNAILETLRGAGHWLHAEQPEAFAHWVRLSMSQI